MAFIIAELIGSERKII